MLISIYLMLFYNFVILVCFLPIILDLIISDSVGASFESMADEDQMFLSALLRSLYQVILPYFMAGFVVFGLLRYAFHKMNLDNPDAVRKEF